MLLSTMASPTVSVELDVPPPIVSLLAEGLFLRGFLPLALDGCAEGLDEAEGFGV
jgi:hypothetical protein